LFVELPDGSYKEYSNIDGVHAEDLFLADLPSLIRQFETSEGSKITFTLMLNRTPCDRCAGNLSREQRKYQSKIDLIIRATNTYAKKQRGVVIPLTTMEKLIEMYDSGIRIEVWNIWEIIKQAATDPMIQELDQETIDKNLEGKSQLERQLQGLKVQIEKRRRISDAKKG
jgi:hypothetical protein